jgi:hypothetical protein
VLNVLVQPEPPGLMLGITQNGPTQLVAGNIYEGLLRYDEKLNPSRAGRPPGRQQGRHALHLQAQART